MAQQTLHEIFKHYLESTPTHFKNRDALSLTYLPEIAPHREEQINQLARILAPSLKGSKVSNVFMYGKSGTGKTLVAQHVAAELERMSPTIKPLYINCKMKKVANTEYRLLAELSRVLGRRVPATGLPTDEIYNIFLDAVEKNKQNVVLILDEIDELVNKIGDSILYTLTRNLELKTTKLSIIGISNDISFTDRLDPRVKSSLSQEEILFPPYNAVQLQDILVERSKISFAPSALADGVIQKCAALAAQEHGDARKALDLLRIAGELAERENAPIVSIDHVDKAEEKIDLDRVVEIVRSQPRQSKFVLLSIIRLADRGDKNLQTGDVFSYYEQVCKNTRTKILTPRRVSDLIAELDSMGIISTKVISKGRYGRTREIQVPLSTSVRAKIRPILEEAES